MRAAQSTKSILNGFKKGTHAYGSGSLDFSCSTSGNQTWFWTICEVVCVYTRIIGGTGSTCKYTCITNLLGSKFRSNWVQLPESTEYGTLGIVYSTGTCKYLHVPATLKNEVCVYTHSFHCCWSKLHQNLGGIQANHHVVDAKLPKKLRVRCGIDSKPWSRICDTLYGRHKA